VDWQEIGDLGQFLETLRKSKMNKECLIVGIASDLLDLRQSFAAGVRFLIHKPASVVQIARCLQAAYSAIIVKRRKPHREPVRIAATLHIRSIPLLSATIVNLSSQGAGLKLDAVEDNHRLSQPSSFDTRKPEAMAIPSKKVWAINPARTEKPV
jgi:hypothetical protein